MLTKRIDKKDRHINGGIQIVLTSRFGLKMQLLIAGNFGYGSIEVDLHEFLILNSVSCVFL